MDFSKKLQNYGAKIGLSFSVPPTSCLPSTHLQHSPDPGPALCPSQHVSSESTDLSPTSGGDNEQAIFQNNTSVDVKIPSVQLKLRLKRKEMATSMLPTADSPPARGEWGLQQQQEKLVAPVALRRRRRKKKKKVTAIVADAAIVSEAPCKR